MLKTPYALLLLLLLAIYSCQAPQQKVPDYKTIEQLLHAQTDEWNKGSIDGFMKGYWHSEELKFITQRGIRMGYDSVSNSYKRNYNTPEKMGHLTFTDLGFTTLDASGEIVQCTGHWNVTGANGSQSGMFSLLFKQIEGEWKIIVDHTW